MGEVKGVASNLMQMLGARQKEAKSLVGTMHELQSCLEEESSTIICGGLDRLLSRIRAEAAERTRLVVVLISPEGMVSVGESYNVNSDSWLERLKSQGFSILTLGQFGSFIRSLQSEVVQGNYMPAIEVLRANAFLQRASPYPAPSVRKAEEPREPSAPSEWKASDFLPALPSHPPLPRGLFKD